MLRKWREDRQYRKYENQLITRRIRLWDVPESLRRNPTYARRIYITGFQADRMVSRERYGEDLLKLETEIALVDALGNCPVLLDRLQTVLRDMQRNLKLFELYDISDFH
jgi:hypothetical protein